MNIDEQRIFYNDRWANFEYIRTKQLARSIAILDTIHSIMLEKKLQKPRILDLGCGVGWLSAMLGLIGPTVGVELSDTAVREAAQRWPYVEFRQADIMSWEYPQGAFDIVVSQEVIEHIEDQARFIQMTADLLAPGGVVILTTPNARTFMALSPKARQEWTNQPLEDWLTVSQLRDLMTPHFKTVQMTTIIPNVGQAGSYRWVNSHKLHRVLKALGLFPIFDQWRANHEYGLHTLAVGHKA